MDNPRNPGAYLEALHATRAAFARRMGVNMTGRYNGPFPVKMVALKVVLPPAGDLPAHRAAWSRLESEFSNVWHSEGWENESITD